MVEMTRGVGEIYERFSTKCALPQRILGTCDSIFQCSYSETLAISQGNESIGASWIAAI